MKETTEEAVFKGQSGSGAASSFKSPLSITGILDRAHAFSPRRTSLTLAAGDFFILCLTFIFCVLVRYILGGQFELQFYYLKLPFLLLIPIVFWSMKLYPGMLYPPHIEIRNLSTGTSLVYLLYLAMSFLVKDSAMYSRIILFSSWLLSLATVPVFRSFVRHWGAKHEWWGRPVVIFGSDKDARKLFMSLNSRRLAGLYPLCLVRLDSDVADKDDSEQALPSITMHQATRLARIKPHPIAIAIFHDITPQTEQLMQQLSTLFRRVLFIPGFLGLTNIWLRVRDLGSTLAIQAEHKLLDPTRLRTKRYMDLAMIFLSLPVVLPLCGFLALIIWLYDRGPVLYSQERIGYGGEPIRIWKFRSMVVNADSILAKHLAENPELAEEWKQSHKLQKDPRITGPGHLLRRLSLDELPQLYSVLKGDISLVGPRPIVQAEIEKYGKDFELLKQVPGGLTGLWQISGRSQTSYERRVELDAYYIRNWSVWLDVYIIAKTPMALLRTCNAC